MFRDTPLITKGIKSYVYQPTDDRPDPGQVCGHVALFDWDESTLDEVEELLIEKGIAGPTVIWESSEGSLHGWNLLCRPFEETAKVLDLGGDDGKHRSVGETRGYWRLRVGPKVKPYGSPEGTGEVYKPATEYRETVVVGGYEQYAISAPHFDLACILSSRHRILYAADLCMATEAWGFVGECIEQVFYSTFTDEGKAIQRQAVTPGTDS